MTSPQANNPLHGITLETILTRLVTHYGWYRLGKKITINCFTKTPSIKSSLKFLRKTPWARAKVERLYLQTRFINRPEAKTTNRQQPINTRKK